MELEKIDSRPLLRANIPLLFNFLFSILIFTLIFAYFGGVVKRVSRESLQGNLIIPTGIIF